MPKVDFKITHDNTKEILKNLDQKASVAFKAMGDEAVTYAMNDCPVDTSRLKNSIAWATYDGKGGGDSDPHGTPEKNSVYIGTNVEYADYVEYGDRKHTVGKKHFLRDAAATHVDHYLAILEAALKSI